MNLYRSLLAAAILCNVAFSAYAAPLYPEEMPGKPDKKALQKVEWRLDSSSDATGIEHPVTIMGNAEATQEQMVNYIRKNNPRPKLTCSLEFLVKCYYDEAERENIRPDVALCQAIRETGFFRYGNDVKPDQNNFCGLGAVGNRAGGASFETAELGVRAHIQHLMAYASKELPSTDIIDPRYMAVMKFRPQHFGKSQYWTDLNGTWAIPGRDYGEGILRFWRAAREMEGGYDKAPYYRALLLGQQKKYKEAVKELRELLDHAPKSRSAEILNTIAVMEIKQKKYKEAWKDLYKAAEMDPASVAILSNQESFDRCLKKKK